MIINGVSLCTSNIVDINWKYNESYQIYVYVIVILLSRLKILQRYTENLMVKELEFEKVNVSINTLYHYIRW